MAGYFLLRAGVMLGEKPLIDDALHQFYWHIHYLQDEDTSLWYHGYNHLNKDHMSGMYWARANAWAAYTMSRVGRCAASLPVPSIYAYYKLARDQLAAIKSRRKTTASGAPCSTTRKLMARCQPRLALPRQW